MMPAGSLNCSLAVSFALTACVLVCQTPISAQVANGQDDAEYVVERFAGTGKPPSITKAYPPGYPSSDARSVPLGNPFGVEVDKQEVWVTTVDDHCVWQMNINEDTIRRVAGNGTKGYSGDGGPAENAQFNWPHEVRVDQNGDLYIADTRNHVIRKVDAGSGIVTTIAGAGTPGYAGDGHSGTSVQFQHPHSVVLDGDGGLLVADTRNHRLRKISLDSGTVTTICGTGEPALPSEGSFAPEAPLHGPRSLAVDSESIWIALREGNSIWRIDRNTNKLHRIAGTGEKGYSGDGGPPRDAKFNGPKGLAIDSKGRILVVDTENQAVRRIDLDQNVIETVLGGSKESAAWTLKRPHGIAPLSDPGLLLGDSENHRVLIAR